jgi:hypothetical protein
MKREQAGVMVAGYGVVGLGGVDQVQEAIICGDG